LGVGGYLESGMRDFRELKVWEKGHRLTLAVYKTTASFPRDELYGLTSQIRRSCASIPANIAEGCGRSGDTELARFLRIAMGSASELEYHLLLAHDLGLLNGPNHERLTKEVTEVKHMLTSFTKKLKADC
jgi:four helix bundle protein